MKFCKNSQNKLFKLVILLFLQLVLVEKAFAADGLEVSKNKDDQNFESKFSAKTAKNQEAKLKLGDLSITPQAFKKSSSANNHNFGVKTKIGYDLNKNVSAFAGFDAADIAVNSEQKSAKLRANKFGNGVVEVGSQVKFSEDANLSISYSQNRQNSVARNSAAAARNNSENSVKIGTSIKF